jgi:hypothetical protein
MRSLLIQQHNLCSGFETQLKIQLINIGNTEQYLTKVWNIRESVP